MRKHNAPKGGKVQLSCGNCGATIYRFPSHIPASGIAFCSISCHRKTVLGEEHQNWRDARWSSGETGYVCLTVPGRGRVYEHRYVMEQHLGRRLRRDEHVHHIDGDKTNNALSNLRLLTEAEHKSLHGKIIRAKQLGKPIVV